MSQRRLIQYISDIHLERRTNLPKINILSDTLLIAGDIGNPNSEIYKQYMSEVNKNYKKVFIVDGNHEWDYNTCKKTNVLFKKRFNDFQNIEHLENSWKFIDNEFVIIGCTLWTPYIKSHCIVNFNSVLYIHNYLYEFHKRKLKVLVLTHHLPSFSLIAEKYKNNHNKNRFANELDYMFYQNWSPKFWICGHSHSFIQKKIGNTFCGINTFGEKYESYFEI